MNNPETFEYHQDILPNFGYANAFIKSLFIANFKMDNAQNA